MNRWYNVHDALPAIDAKCIVLDNKGHISFAHMVDKNVAVDYDGWNIPDVVWWTHFDPSEELEEYYGQNVTKTKEDEGLFAPDIHVESNFGISREPGEKTAQTDVTIAELAMSRLLQNDRANFERIILISLQFLDQGEVAKYLSTATLDLERLYRYNEELGYPYRKERLNKPKEE